MIDVLVSEDGKEQQQQDEDEEEDESPVTRWDVAGARATWVMRKLQAWGKKKKKMNTSTSNLVDESTPEITSKKSSRTH